MEADLAISLFKELAYLPAVTETSWEDPVCHARFKASSPPDSDLGIFLRRVEDKK